MRLVLTNCKLIDCVTLAPISQASVVIDLDGAYLLPGLWDIHIHPEYPAPPGQTIAEQTARFGHALMQRLTEAGVVGVRTGGAAHFMDVAWKRTFDSGQVAGPRVFAAGQFLTTTGGHFLFQATLESATVPTVSSRLSGSRLRTGWTTSSST